MATASSVTNRSLHHPSGRARLSPPTLDGQQAQAPAPALAVAFSSSSSSSSSLPAPAPASIGTILSSGTSNVSMFLANLRLLEMDQLPDWPDITSQTFVYGSATTTAGAHGQKKRVQCVEWALVRLFELWDPDEAKTVSSPVAEETVTSGWLLRSRPEAEH